MGRNGLKMIKDMYLPMLKFSWKTIRKYHKEPHVHIERIVGGNTLMVGTSHQPRVNGQFGSMFRFFFHENCSISCFETWWADSSPWKEAIALFFLALFGVPAIISGTISLYGHFLTTTRKVDLKFGRKLPSIYLRVFRSLVRTSLRFHFY